MADLETVHDTFDHTGLPGVGGGASLVGDRATVTSDLSTASSSFVDAAGLSVTVTTGARRCLIGFQGSMQVAGASFAAGDSGFLTLAIDGTDQGGTLGLIGYRATTASYRRNMSFVHMTAVLTAASHTFKLRYRCSRASNGEAKLMGTDAQLMLWVAELPF